MIRERTFGFAIKSMSNQLKRMFDKSAIHDNEAGLTGMQYGVLGYIARRIHRDGADVFQRDIETEFDVRRSTATSLLQLMEKNGILRREAMPGDLRLKRIVLSDKGTGIHRQHGKRIEKIEAILMEGVEQDDLAAFYRVMTLASQNIQRHLAGGDPANQPPITNRTEEME